MYVIDITSRQNMPAAKQFKASADFQVGKDLTVAETLAFRVQG